MSDQQSNDQVVQISGNVGQEPEQRDGSEYINFSVAVTKSYAQKLTTWVRVGTKNPGLVEFVKGNIHKGTPVAVEGFMRQDVYNGKPQFNMTAARIGTINYGVGTKRDTEGQQAAGFQWGS